MNSNRMRNVGLLAAPLAALALLSGCGSDETGTAESSPAPASTTTASAPTTQTGTASPSTTHTDHTQTTTSTAPNPEGCAIGELNVTLASRVAPPVLWSFRWSSPTRAAARARSTVSPVSRMSRERPEAKWVLQPAAPDPVHSSPLPLALPQRLWCELRTSRTTRQISAA